MTHAHPLPPLVTRGRLALTLPELEHWGEELGRSITQPLVISIKGELGAGKTTLAQAICRGYGVTQEVTSPTYALVHEYASPKGPVHHLDLYRLSDEKELTNIGYDEIVASNALVLIEWPERAGSRLPPGHLPIDLDYVPGDESRRILLAG